MLQTHSNAPITILNKKMKLGIIAALSIIVASEAFVGPIRPTSTKTEPTELSAALSRRSVISLTSGVILGTLASPKPGQSRSTANPQFDSEVNFEPSQQARGEKIDINGAFVVDYKQFPGMYPGLAGKIASHGPYTDVKDILKIPGVTENDKKMFKKYQAELTVLPPGRMFDERINQRQST
ncbi:hypothetical protein ACHAXA_003218 [Cyclostephanos tholiformis]|uniref:Photosystem II 12 kDa extrinsic protein n=1 Tax=Cyclostephanos tholiformis TaxID=382380 RepID=A0ABD3RYK6_9STRA